MSRKIEIVNGVNLTDFQVHQINSIYLSAFVDYNYSVERKEDFEELFDYLLKDITFIIGEDWFIVYSVEDDYIDILLWAAKYNSDNKISQSVEMYNALKTLFLRYYNCYFTAEMIHSTSYQFYLKMLEKGYINPNYDFLKLYNLNLLEQLKLKIIGSDNVTNQVLDSGLFIRDERLYKVIHEVNFELTDSFKRKYCRKR